MRESVIIVNCDVPEEAAHVLKKLRKNASTKGYTISQAAIVKMGDEKLELVDGFVNDDVAEGYGWTGGLIGALVGLLGGPLGALLGGAAGSLIGGGLSKLEQEGGAVLLEKASECLTDGETAILVMCEEENDDALAARLEEFSVSITRIDAEEIASEIAHVEEQGLAQEEAPAAE